MPRRAWLILGALTIAAICVAWWMRGGSGSPSGGTTGNAADLPPSQWRFVVLSPALAVTMKHYGLDDLIVGRHGYDMVLDKSIPVCGDQAGIDYEALLRVQPTHVFIEWGSRPLPERVNQLATEHRWTIRTYAILTIDELVAVSADVWSLAMERAGSEEGAELGGARTEEPRVEFDRALARQDSPWTGRVLLLASTDPSAAVGPGSFHHEILVRLGGIPAIAEGRAWVELDVEDLLHVAPDAIVLILPRAYGTPAHDGAWSWAEIESRLGQIATLDIPAVRDRRVVLFDDPLYHTPSTAMLDFASELREALASWSLVPDP